MAVRKLHPEGLDLPTRDQNTTAIAIAGDIDMSTAGIVRSHLEHALRSPPAKLVLDLGKVTFLGSEGLALLLDLRTTTTEKGTELVLRGAKRRVIYRPLQVTGLVDMFVIE